MHSQIIVNGIIAGSIYALIAIGYTMIYGIGKFINFAHGEMCMAGALLFYFFKVQLGMDVLLSASLSISLISILGIALEKVAYKPFRDKSKFVPLINTIGASVFLQGLFSIFFGPNAKSLRGSAEVPQGLVFFGTFISPVQILIIVATFVLAALLFLLLRKSKVGKALRATSEDREIATVLGVNIDPMISATFAIGSGLAALAGILVGYDQTVSPTMGAAIGIKAFTAAVLGGIGSVGGAVAGGFAIGIIESYVGLYMSSGYKEGMIFLVLLFLLFFRPQGIIRTSSRRT